MNNGGQSKVLLSVIALLLLAIVGYNVYSGVAIRKLGIPGIFEVEFGDKPNAGSSPTATATPTPKASPTITATPTPAKPFQGAWRNQDPNTSSITRLTIEQDANRVSVHAWGKCTPQDCDWGVESGTVSGDAATVLWDQGFVRRTMKIALSGSSRLVVTVDSVYTDNRPPQHWQETFVKSP